MVTNSNKDKTVENNCDNSEFFYCCCEEDFQNLETLKIIVQTPGNKFNYVRVIKTNKKLIEWIMTKTNHINPNSNLKTRIYMILNNIKIIPACKTCGKDFNINIINSTVGFSKFCGPKCANLDKDTHQKKLDTCLKHYGTKYPTSLDSIKEKVKNTIKAKYGVDNIMHLKSSVNKIKKTKLEKYGDENWNNKAKSKQTCIERYGVEFSTQSEEMKTKSKSTCLERYGVENGGGSQKALKKIKNTNLKKRGVEYPMQDQSVIKKAKNTFIEKYGVDTPFKMEKTKTTNKIRTKTKSYNKFILNNEFDEPMFSLQEYIDRTDDTQIFEFKCKKCGNIFKTTHHDGYHSKCPICYPTFNGTSNEEKEVFEFIQSLINEPILKNTRDIISPMELDIYIPSKKIAIEFDGLYWHNLEYKDKFYHLTKTKLCEANGIQLIHIFENEWIVKQKIVKSRIANLLGINTKSVYARNCTIKEIDNKTAKLFFDKNHIQGGINSNINIGLEYENEIIGIMSFSKSRFSNRYQYELTRYSSKLGYRIIGGAGKLLKYFEKNYNPKSLISYADRRWSTGKMYESLGFVFQSNSFPNYWYFKSNDLTKLESRIKYQKHKLKNILVNFDTNKTEIQNMIANGFNAIYDCGNKVYIKEY